MKDILNNNLSIGNKVFVLPLKKFSNSNFFMKAIIIDINEDKKLAKCKLLEDNFLSYNPILRSENQIVLYKL